MKVEFLLFTLLAAIEAATTNTTVLPKVTANATEAAKAQNPLTTPTVAKNLSIDSSSSTTVVKSTDAQSSWNIALVLLIVIVINVTLLILARLASQGYSKFRSYMRVRKIRKQIAVYIYLYKQKQQRIRAKQGAQLIKQQTESQTHRELIDYEWNQPESNRDEQPFQNDFFQSPEHHEKKQATQEPSVTDLLVQQILRENQTPEPSLENTAVPEVFDKFKNRASKSILLQDFGQRSRQDMKRVAPDPTKTASYTSLPQNNPSNPSVSIKDNSAEHHSQLNPSNSFVKGAQSEKADIKQVTPVKIQAVSHSGQQIYPLNTNSTKDLRNQSVKQQSSQNIRSPSQKKEKSGSSQSNNKNQISNLNRLIQVHGKVIDTTEQVTLTQILNSNFSTESHERKEQSILPLNVQDQTSKDFEQPIELLPLRSSLEKQIQEIGLGQQSIQQFIQEVDIEQQLSIEEQIIAAGLGSKLETNQNKVEIRNVGFIDIQAGTGQEGKTSTKNKKSGKQKRTAFQKAATMTLKVESPIMQESERSPQDIRTRTPPDLVGSTHQQKVLPKIFIEDTEELGNRNNVMDNDPTQDGDSVMRYTKEPTDASNNNWYKSQSVPETNIQGGSVVDFSRLQSLGMGKLATKIGENLQSKVAAQMAKYEQPVKLKVMSKKEIKNMKNQFSAFFQEPKTKAQALAALHR